MRKGRFIKAAVCRVTVKKVATALSTSATSAKEEESTKKKITFQKRETFKLAEPKRWCTAENTIAVMRA